MTIGASAHRQVALETPAISIAVPGSSARATPMQTLRIGGAARRGMTAPSAWATTRARPPSATFAPASSRTPPIRGAAFLA